MQTQTMAGQWIRYRKRHGPIDEHTSLPTPKRTCFMEFQGRKAQESLDTSDDMEPRLLPPSLLRPYLIARMERAETDPCLLSVLITRSVDLILSNHPSASLLTRYQLFKTLVQHFDPSLLNPPFTKNTFTTLFSPVGLNYWLPLFTAAHPTTYPSPSHSLRIFYLFRHVHISTHSRTQHATEEAQDLVMELLQHPPTTPVYARLFAIDALNLVARCQDKKMLGAFLASRTGALVSGFDAKEHVWCAVKQGQGRLARSLLRRAFVGCGAAVESGGLVDAALLVVTGLVEFGQETWFGCMVVGELVRCGSVREVKEFCRDWDLEDCTQLYHRAADAGIDI